VPIEAGQQLLHYRLIEKIGEGGMGAVWRAHDTTLDREVAVKVLPEPLSHDAERLTRFDREAKLLASLNHPNVAAIYGFHRAAGTSFLAMELVEGEDLSQRLARGPLAVDETLDVGRQIAEALEAAHERCVVHRDLKPANVKLTPEGKIKVLDFGLAKAMSPESASGGTDPSFSPTMTSAGTQAGVILGTAAYMSPEQARGRPLDRRTDLWSFGCVLHECLTGTQLFRGETVSDSLAAILRKDLDWSELPERTPPMVRRLLQRCLTRDPRKRQQDAGDARIELEQAIEDPSEGLGPAPEAAPPEARGLRWLPWTVAAAATVVAIFFAMHRAAPSSEPTMTRRLTIPVPGPTEFGDLAASPPAISPDGRLVVFGAEGEGESKLWLRPLNDFTARPLAGTEEAEYAFWSPDSRHVGFFRGGKLRRVELATGREQSIGGEGSSYPRGGSWNARGQIVFAPNSNAGIYLIAASGGEARQITTPDPEVPDASHRWPWFLPDGEHFLFTLWTNDPAARQQHGGVYVASLSGDEEPRRIASDASNAAYAPSGHLIVARGENLIALAFDARTKRVSGEPAVVASGVLGNSSNGHNAFSISAEGTLVSTPTPVEAAAFLNFSLAPDAARAAAVIPGATGDGEIWIVDLARGVRTRLAHGAVQYDYPVWSHDGDRILYGTQERGALDFFVRPSDGSGGSEPVFLDDGDKVLFDWSRDGRYLAYWPMGSGSGTPDVWIYSLERQTAESLISGDPAYDDARFSPDGRWISYVSDDSGRREVFVQALGGEDGMTGGARWQLSTAGGQDPHWHEEGREVLYVDLEQRVMAVAVEERDGRLQLDTPRELFTIDGTIVDLDATGDHQRLLVATRDRVNSEPLHVVVNWPSPSLSGTR
jgi:Tol biopolymer transport system component